MATPSLNRPCPCGSGKQYKRCHYGKELPTNWSAAHPQLGRMATVHSHDLLATIGALFLYSPNYGKNVRLETLAMYALEQYRVNDDRPRITLDQLNFSFGRFKDGRELEDAPIAPFCENVISDQGNHVVLSGIASSDTELLNQMLEILLTWSHQLPRELVTATDQAASIMLYISDQIAHKAGLVRYQMAQDGSFDDAIDIPDGQQLNGLKDAVRFNKRALAEKCNQLGLAYLAIIDFLVDPSDLGLSGSMGEPLIIEKPILDAGLEFICISPATIVTSLIRFIYKRAEQLGVKDQLLNVICTKQQQLCGYALYAMGFRMTDIFLPAKDPTLAFSEKVFFIDTQKLAYVAIVEGVGEHMDRLQKEDYRNRWTERYTRISRFLRTSQRFQVDQIFAIFIMTETSQDRIFASVDPIDRDRVLVLRLSELAAIAYRKNTDQLTLWKFAGAYQKAGQRVMLVAPGGLMDCYVVMEKNGGTLWETHQAIPEQGAMVTILPGSSNSFQQEVKVDRDQHAVFRWHNGMAVFSEVRRYKEYAPIYIEMMISDEHRLLIETYTVPIWVLNEQKKYKTAHFWGHDICEAVAFWLHKIEPALRDWIGAINLVAIEIKLEVDGAIQDLSSVTDAVLEAPYKGLFVSATETGIELTLSTGFMNLLTRPDNMADKELLKTVLAGLSELPHNRAAAQELSPDQLTAAVDQYLVPDNAKMMIYQHSGSHPRMDANRLPGIRYLQLSEITIVHDNLLIWLGTDYPFAATYSNKAEKTGFINDIVAGVYAQLATEIAQYDAGDLLEHLIRYHERTIYEREARDFYLPPRIACFSSVAKEVVTLKENDAKLVPITLAYRTLVELVATKPPTGDRLANVDDVDYLLALADAINSYGMMSDAINWGFSNPEISVSAAGKLKVDKEFENDFTDQYRSVRAETEVFKIQEQFDHLNTDQRVVPATEFVKERQELDNVFYVEYGISFTQYLDLINLLFEIGAKDGAPFVKVGQQELWKIMAQNLTNFTPAQTINALDMLTLQRRATLNEPTADQKFTDIATWRYNRDLSYLQRPLALFEAPVGAYYLYGYRHLLDTRDKLRRLISLGKLKAQSKEMLSYLGMVSEKRGKVFRNKVHDYFNIHSGLHVIPYEVTIKPKGHLVATMNLGDVDVLVVDHGHKRIYALECKAIYGARNIAEMKQETDEYLGKPGASAKGKIFDHLTRHQWLMDNYEQVATFLKLTSAYRVCSWIITAEPIPTPLLKGVEVPLPVISLIQLRNGGIALLNH